MPPAERILDLAHLSVGRAFLFAVLGIAAVTCGLMGWPVMAFKTGALLSSLLLVGMVIKAHEIERRPYRRTEVWVLLGKPARVPAERIQAAIRGAIRDACWRFADYAAVMALVLWAAAFLFWLAGAAA